MRIVKINRKKNLKLAVASTTFVCLLSLSLMTWSNTIPKVLVLNSDATVDKYTIAQDEFSKELPCFIQKVDLSQDKKIKDIEKIIENNSVSIIYCIGVKACMSLHHYNRQEYIIFSSILNSFRLPMRSKTYGISNEILSGIQITLFRYIFPKINNIGVLYSEKYNQEWFDQVQLEADRLGIKVMGSPVSESKKTLSELKNLLSQIHAFWLISDPIITPNKESLLKIISTCDSVKIPIFSYNQIFAELGVTMTVSVDDQTIGRQAADIAKQIVLSKKIDEHVQFPAGSHIVLNLKKVNAYSLEYNKDALSSINTIIE
ncbi:MAG: hypothetical protein HQK77_05430 [Desulfobacterales bacterium]|nr:hypothetical protein [Desulfobacterales bacterium]